MLYPQVIGVYRTLMVQHVVSRSCKDSSVFQDNLGDEVSKRKEGRVIDVLLSTNVNW